MDGHIARSTCSPAAEKVRAATICLPIPSGASSIENVAAAEPVRDPVTPVGNEPELPVPTVPPVPVAKSPFVNRFLLLLAGTTSNREAGCWRNRGTTPVIRVAKLLPRKYPPY